MLVKCPVCGTHVPEEVAVEAATAAGLEAVCSLRCAEVAEAERGARVGGPAALPEPPRRILVAVDGSGPSLRATELAASLARAFKGSVALVHAVDPRLMRWLPTETALAGAERLGLRTEDVERQLRADAEAQLERCRRLCEEAGVPVTAQVELDVPVRALAAAAEQADLVVMGSRGLGAISGAALGSLSHRLLGATRKPLLVVH
jgi:nucleotide-binding universal stress UspA family protein